MMESFCSSSVADERFAQRLLTETDCQAFGLIERGYTALAQPGGTVSTALTGLLVIAVAFFGYRLLLGRGLALQDAVALAVKIGIVLMIAGSWESWQALAYQGLARAPAQIASDMLVGIGASPPIESLQRALDDLTAASVGYRSRAGIASPLVGGPAAAAAVLNLSSVLLTLSIVGLLIATRVVLAVLLAIAPAMAGLILFNGTRGMAQGWLGAMAAAALAPLFVLIVAAVEFAILAPMILRLLAEQAAGRFENGSVMPVGLVVLVFAIALVLAVRAGARIGYGIRLAPDRWSRRNAGESVPLDRPSARERLMPPGALAATPGASRALETISRRDTAVRATGTQGIGGARASRAIRDGAGAAPVTAGTIVQQPVRHRSRLIRSTPRRSRAAARRDA